MLEFQQNPKILRLSQAAKNRLNILYLAKWALGDGSPDVEDGTHATYHAELREILKDIGLNITPVNRYEDILAADNPDYVFTLLNRGGFQNSEMLGPLLCVKQGLPHLGASPIIRGLGDDKHLMKLATRAKGVITPDWKIYRRGGGDVDPPSFVDRRMIVKPNASSASWGIKRVTDWPEALEHVRYLWDHGHDVIVEDFIKGYELAIPVIGANGPWCIPIVKFNVPDPDAVRTYEQKRHLEADGGDSVTLSILEDDTLTKKIQEVCIKILPEVWPADYLRFEFKYHPETDTLNFIELNLSCNIWSKKATGFAFRQVFGRPHKDIIETFLCHSLLRQGVIAENDISEENLWLQGK